MMLCGSRSCVHACTHRIVSTPGVCNILGRKDELRVRLRESPPILPLHGALYIGLRSQFLDDNSPYESCGYQC